MQEAEKQPDVVDDAARETAAKLLIGCDIYTELTERLLDAGRKVEPGEWEARVLRRMREPALAFPVEDAIIAAAERVYKRMEGH